MFYVHFLQKNTKLYYTCTKNAIFFLVLFFFISLINTINCKFTFSVWAVLTDEYSVLLVSFLFVSVKSLRTKSMKQEIFVLSSINKPYNIFTAANYNQIHFICLWGLTYSYFTKYNIFYYTDTYSVFK